MMKRYIHWIPALAWMAMIFFMSHQSGSNLNSVLPWFQRLFPFMQDFNWGHFVAYFVLALTFYWALGRTYANIRGRLIVVLLCVLYGMTDEIHQLFVSGRTADWIDLRNDAIGAFIAMFFVSIRAVHAVYLSWRK